MHSQTRAAILECYRAVCDGYSPDRVVADPVLNAAFLAKCRQQGLTTDAATLNRGLLNCRKAGYLRGLKSRRTVVEDLDEYLFAAEIAARIIERKRGCTLDAILCDPELAVELDGIAAELAPGFSPLQYRWAAFNLRKSRKLRPEMVAQVVPPESVTIYRVKDVDLSQVPSEQGLYIFHTRVETLYVGEAISLRNRIGKHLEHSDNKHLARWLWESGSEDLFLELQVLAKATSTRIRRALESELIASRKPTFNVRP